jgi:hypothetical protein
LLHYSLIKFFQEVPLKVEIPPLVANQTIPEGSMAISFTHGLTRPSSVVYFFQFVPSKDEIPTGVPNHIVPLLSPVID